MKKDEFSVEELETAKRHLEARCKKLELAIEKAKKDLDELNKPKGLFASSNKKQIAAAEEQLIVLENNLIDFQAMDAAGYLKLKKAEDRKNTFKSVLSDVGDVVKKVGVAIPVPGAGAVGKIVGNVLKNLSK